MHMILFVVVLVGIVNCQPIAQDCIVPGDCADAYAWTNDKCVGELCFNVPDSGRCFNDTDCPNLDLCTIGSCSLGNNSCTYQTSPSECCVEDCDCVGYTDPCNPIQCNSTNQCELVASSDPWCCTNDSDCSDTGCIGNTCNLATNRCSASTTTSSCCTSNEDCWINETCHDSHSYCDSNGRCAIQALGTLCTDHNDCNDFDVNTCDICVWHPWISGCGYCVNTVQGNETCCIGICLGSDVCNLGTGLCEPPNIFWNCHSPSDCYDSNICTTDICINQTCSYSGNPSCCSTDDDCDDANCCTWDHCEDGGECRHLRYDPCDCCINEQCDDGIVSTIDLCIERQCEHLDIPGRCSCSSDCMGEADDGPCDSYVCDDIGSDGYGHCVVIHEPMCCDSDDDCNCCEDEPCVAAVCWDPTHKCDKRRRAPGPGCCGTDDDCAPTSPHVCDRWKCEVNGQCANWTIPNCCVNDSQCTPPGLCEIGWCDIATSLCHFADIPGCNCTSDADCNDTDICTLDYCSLPNNKCIHDYQPGCCNVDLDCMDTDVCTFDFCLPLPNSFEYPICQNTIITVPPCCYSGGDCGDGNICTRDICTIPAWPGVPSCSNPPYVSSPRPAGCCASDTHCNDSDFCTTDDCLGNYHCSNTWISGCCHNDSDCHYNGTWCSVEFCNTTSNQCQLADQCPSAAAPCYINLCNDFSQTCSNITICDTSDPCQTWSCFVDPMLGDQCIYTPVTCASDGDLCTLDTCVPYQGCTYPQKVCTDGDICTLDTCNNLTGNCEFPPKCDDANACTNDSCNPINGLCLYVHKVCPSDDACSSWICNTITGSCDETPIDCNDGNACTTDSCDDILGCQHVAITCIDGDPCTVDTCVAAVGCVYPPRDCSSIDLPCGPGVCQPITGMCQVQSNCTLAPNCFDNICDPFSGQCVPIAVVCVPTNSCSNATCNPGTGLCEETFLNCDPDSCHTATCILPSGCQYTPLNCSDGDVCTIDDCDPSPSGGCFWNDTSCPDTSPCFDPICVPFVGCEETPTNCSDGFGCTQDLCDELSGCYNPPVVCVPTNACVISNCTEPSGDCIETLIVCTTASVCEIGVCDPVLGCIHVAPDCDDADECTFDVCDVSPDPPGIPGCQHLAISCDDGRNCTIDTCVPATGCNNTVIPGCSEESSPWLLPVVGLVAIITVLLVSGCVWACISYMIAPKRHCHYYQNRVTGEVTRICETDEEHRQRLKRRKRL